jgi:hypothetical protein
MFNKIKSVRDVIREQLTIIRRIPEHINSAVGTISNLAATLKETAGTIEKTYAQIQNAFEQKPPPQKPASTTTDSSEIIIEAEYTETTATPQISHQRMR